jgi:hypothetical protein
MLILADKYPKIMRPKQLFWYKNNMCFYVKRYIFRPMTVISRDRFIKGCWLRFTAMREISQFFFAPGSVWVEICNVVYKNKYYSMIKNLC